MGFRDGKEENVAIVEIMKKEAMVTLREFCVPYCGDETYFGLKGGVKE